VKNLLKKPEERTAPGGHRCKRECIKINIKEKWPEGVDWIQVA
jgi:hypothetical protein